MTKKWKEIDSQKDITSPEVVTLTEENDNEVFKLLNYEYISFNLCLVFALSLDKYQLLVHIEKW